MGELQKKRNEKNGLKVRQVRHFGSRAYMVKKTPQECRSVILAPPNAAQLRRVKACFPLGVCALKMAFAAGFLRVRSATQMPPARQ